MDRRRLYGLALLAFFAAMCLVVSTGVAEVAENTPDLIYVTPSPAAVEETSPITFAAAVPKEPTIVRRTSKPAASVGSGVERWRSLVERYFGENTDAALRVMQGESRGNPRADNGWCRGLFQIHECHAAKFRQKTGLAYFDGVFDAEANIRFAAYMSRGGECWDAWSVKP